jgi:citrate synthase
MGVRQEKEMKETDETSEDAERRLLAKFRRSVKQLNSIMEELREIHPKASYYLAADSLHMMKGPSHGDDHRSSPLHENSLGMVTLWHSGGGDW